MNHEEKRSRQRLASSRYLKAHREEINRKARERYAEHFQMMRAKSREKYARTRQARIASSIKWQEANPEKVQSYQRRRHLWRYHGITIEEWFALFDRQGNLCAICKSASPGAHKSWHTDHCHATGKVRGILCYACNMVLGHAKDSPEVFSAAARYLAK